MKTECCNYEGPANKPYPVFWNPHNKVVQCHNCGAVYNSTSDQLKRAYEVLDLIDGIVSDDFCEDLEMESAHGRLEKDTKVCQEKLSLIYKLAHANSPTHTCYHVHEDWRKLTNDLIKAESTNPA